MTDGFDDGTRRMMGAIERNWDERTPIHAASRFYDVGAKDPESWFAPYEWTDLGDLTGRDVLHLQSHLGTETVAFTGRGAASVAGLDLSAAAVAEARRIAARTGTPVSYVHGNVYNALDVLDGQQYDVVYTGKGALCYLPDLDRWAAVVAGLLRPGGRLLIVEFHPVLVSLGLVPADPDPGLVLRRDYLSGRGARELDATRTYTDGAPLTHETTSYEWAHDLGEVITALIGAGLQIQRLREVDEIPWPRWPSMIPTPEGFWRLPDTEPRIPLLYSLLARKP